MAGIADGGTDCSIAFQVRTSVESVVLRATSLRPSLAVTTVFDNDFWNIGVCTTREIDMPFIKIDEGVMEEFGVETEDDLRASEGKFDYANASADLKAAKLSEVSRALLSALKDLKATHFRVAYDGGHDEGFSYPESVKVGPTRFDISEVSKLLAARPFLKEARAIPKLQRDYPASLSDIEFIRYALDELAYELASTVLGEGFGTGEYELYGAFTVDLHTGQMEDDPDAQPRHIL